MPPTYSPFWKPFEILARIGLVRRHVGAGGLVLGPTDGLDATGSQEWKRYADSGKLYDAWGPPASSTWSAYHRPTLFAALDGFKADAIGPRAPAGFDPRATPRQVPAWCDEKTAVLLDLPGAVSVAYAAFLAARDQRQPVATFNNWPHEKGLVDAGAALAALLSFAPMVADASAARGEADAAPTFVLDADRLGRRKPVPTDFDNRYYLLDSDLPTAQMLQNHGIERVVYVRAAAGDATPRPFDEVDDVNPYLFELSKRLKIQLADARLDTWGLGDAREFDVKLRKTPFTTQKDPAFRGFRRNAAGGFGVLVPEPRSGGAGGFG